MVRHFFRKKFLVGAIALSSLIPAASLHSQDSGDLFWMRVKANDSFSRSVVANTGAAIEFIGEDFVTVTATAQEKQALEKLGWVDVAFPLGEATLSFPPGDSKYHDYAEMKTELEKLAQSAPEIVTLFSIGKSLEGRDILGVRLTQSLQTAPQKPGVIFMGGHHAREHLSVEMPLRLAQRLVAEYKAGNARVQGLINSRDIHIIPAINPDGLEFDISGDRYKFWRKNRRPNGNGTFGVDLNRNYGFQWGTGGSSRDPRSDTFMGPQPFSEPETQAVKNYIETHTNLTVLLSYHTFSQLILYPWGHTNDPIAVVRDRQVYEKMAQKMATWNGYTPQQSSDLYIASGDTTDWSYGVQKIFSFTFELDPRGGWDMGGFYPGDEIIESVVDKNYEPALYLMEFSDNPYRVLDTHPLSQL